MLIMPPEGPKLLMIPSTQPVRYKALEKTLAMKKRVPILPPNSGPRARLIISTTEKNAQLERVSPGRAQSKAHIQ